MTDRILQVPRGLKYRGTHVPWLPATLRRRWSGLSLADLLPESSSSFGRLPVAGLGAGFRPPQGDGRSLGTLLVKLMDLADVGTIPIVEPVQGGTLLDVRGLPGWARAVVSVANQGELLRLDAPPTFGRLRSVAGATGRDVLHAACLVEAAAAAGEERSREETRTAWPPRYEPHALRDELTDWLVRDMGMERSRAHLLAGRYGTSTDRKPTLQDIGDRLGVSRERARQLAAYVDKALDSRRPRFRNLDDLLVAVLAARTMRPEQAVVQLARITGDPEALRRLLTLLGEGRFASLVARALPVLEDGFVRDVCRLVHDTGAAAVHRLIPALEGWECNRSEFIIACASDPEIVVVAGQVVSTRSDSPLDTGLQSALAAVDPQPVVSAYTGALRHVRMRKSAVLPSLDDFQAYLDLQPYYSVVGDEVTAKFTPPPPSGLEELLLRAVDDAEDGLTTREDLTLAAVRRGFSANTVQHYTSSSPVLDFACTGVIRRRGRAAPLRRAEELRRSAKRGARWAAWGWVDGTRFWIQCRMTPAGLSPSPPRDLEALLLGRAFRTLAADRSELGVLEIGDTGELGWDIEDEAPVSADATAVLEFRVGREPAVVVLPGETADDDEYAGDVDGCVLHDGRWWAVLRVDQPLLDGDAHLLPHVLLRSSGLEIGDDLGLRLGGRTTVRLRREPHAGVLLGLGPHLRLQGAVAGSWVRVAVAPPDLLVQLLGSPSSGTLDDLLVRVGIGAGEQDRAFARACSALGLGGSGDRADVVRAFARRGRTDLAEMAAATGPGRPRTPTGPVALVDDSGVVSVRGPDGTMLRPGPAAAALPVAPLGVVWQSGAAEAVPDPVWERWVLGYLRAWLAAAAGAAPTIEVVGGSWSVAGGSHRRLIEALESISPQPHPALPLPNRPTGGLPSTGLGWLHLTREAVDAGLSSLRVDVEAVATTWAGGTSRRAPGLSEALQPPS